MDSFIKKLFSGRTDEYVHYQFQKFSRGEFKNRALVSASRSSSGFTISTSSEYANELVAMIAEKIPEGVKVNVTGVVVSTQDLTGELNFKSKKQFMGVKQYGVDEQFSKHEILELCRKFKKCFLALSFSAGSTSLKIKTKSPKSAKPSSKEDAEPKADFCRIKTSDSSIAEAILFDVSNFKRVNVKHDFIITEIILPSGETEPAKIRENAIRKGRIVRIANVDGKEVRKETEFEA